MTNFNQFLKYIVATEFSSLTALYARNSKTGKKIRTVKRVKRRRPKSLFRPWKIL